MEAFAERARRELLGTGEKVRKRNDETRQQRTSQEEQIARFACDGLSNPEIGERLFISARTVEWHLRKVFTKLGISSRRGLRAALPENTSLAYDAGLRPSEVVMLRPRALTPPEWGWGRLDVVEADVSFDQPGEPKTGERSVPIRARLRRCGPHLPDTHRPRPTSSNWGGRGNAH
jgi:DNA-binding CsgD family transcriptional regulator